MCALHNALVISLWAICQPNHFCHVLWAKSRSRWWWWCCWSCCLLGPQAWNCRAWNYREFFDSYKRYICEVGVNWQLSCLERFLIKYVNSLSITRTSCRSSCQFMIWIHLVRKFLRRNDSCCNWYGYANSMY